MDADLLLVHGFWSSPATWDGVSSRLRDDPELDGLRIHAFEYESPKLRWPLSPARIPDYNDIAQSIPAYLATHAPGATPIAVVTHSQGGLILQRFLAWMLTEGRGRELARFRLAVMLSCPNEGSEYLRAIRAVVGLNHHPQAGQLGVLEREVSEARRIVLRQIVNAVTTDDRNCRIPLYVYSGRTDNIVRRESAQSVFPNAEVLPGDHFSILDPDAPGHLTAQVVKHHLAASLTFHSQAGDVSHARHPFVDTRTDDTTQTPISAHPADPAAEPEQEISPLTSVASRLHHAAGLFNRFATQYASGSYAAQSIERDDRTLLRARLVDMQAALDTLTDAELSTWPDEEFIVMIRMPRNTALCQVIELRSVLAKEQSTDAELHRLVTSLTQIRDLINERVSVQGWEDRSRR